MRKRAKSFWQKAAKVGEDRNTGREEGGRRGVFLPWEEGRKYLVFREGQATLALPITTVRRVYHVEEGFPPRTPRTRLLDLVPVFGGRGDRVHNYWIEIEKGEERFLLPVEEVEGIRSLGAVELIDYPSLLQGPKTSYVKHLLFDGSRMIVEMNCEALTDMSEGKLDGDKRAPSLPKLKKPAALSPAARLLIFQSAGRRWALDLKAVIKTLQVKNDLSSPLSAAEEGQRLVPTEAGQLGVDIYYLPSASPFVHGVTYHEGKAVPVMAPSTLKALFAGERGEGSDRFDIIILAETQRGLAGIGGERILEVVEGVAEPEGGVRYQSLVPGRQMKEDWTYLDLNALVAMME